MFFEHWPVLLVDDEPDVLRLSQISMKRFEVYGLPLEIYTATSKDEAIRLLSDDAELACSLAVAFLDVVMETDHAGLELCEYIRNDLGNKLSQIFIRTGQPGIAPEREVIDKYEINGYFSKTEATQDKLYSLVKSGVRQYLSSGMAQETIELLNNLMVASGSRRKTLHAVRCVGGTSGEESNHRRWLIVDGQVLFAKEVDADQALSLCDRLHSLPGVPLSPYGDKYIRAEDGYQLIEVAGANSKAKTSFLFRSRFAPPALVIDLMHNFVTGLAIAWQQSNADEEWSFMPRTP